MENEKGMFHVFQWNIENFSYWNREIRDKLASPSFTYPVQVEINPNTYNDVSFTIKLCLRVVENEEVIVARLCKDSVFAFFGELHFIGSDGSILFCTQPVISNREQNFLELLPGAKFKEVVAQIRKNEAVHGDHLTVQCRIRSFHKTITDYKQTSIDVLSASFKISSGTLMDSYAVRTEISRLIIPNANGRSVEMVLWCSEDQVDPSKIALKLRPVSFFQKVLVFTQLRLVNSDNEEVRTEKKEHLFRDKEDWVFSNSLTRKSVSKDGVSFIFYFKIIPSIRLKHSIQVSSLHRIMQAPTVLFRDSGATNSEERCSRPQTDVSSIDIDNSVTELTKDFMCLYQDQDFSDFHLKCGDVSIPVHKNILSARSPVFKTMLFTDMQEAVSGCMDIVDLDPSTLSRFLTYLYTGAVEELQGESALKLYYAADKYQVSSLKMRCANFLFDNISISNVCDILSLANRHQDDHLVAAAHDFVLKNYNEVLSSDEWKSFMRSEPLLAVETVTHFAEKRYVGKKDTH